MSTIGMTPSTAKIELEVRQAVAADERREHEIQSDAVVIFRLSLPDGVALEVNPIRVPYNLCSRFSCPYN